MVRVGGGWEDLDKFLQKHDPCRGKQICICVNCNLQLTVNTNRCICFMQYNALPK